MRYLKGNPSGFREREIFLQSNLQSQATRQVGWQAGRSFSNPACVLKLYYNRTLAGACLDFDELANSDEFFQSVSVLSSESYSIILLC